MKGSGTSSKLCEFCDLLTVVSIQSSLELELRIPVLFILFVVMDGGCWLLVNSRVGEVFVLSSSDAALYEDVEFVGLLRIFLNKKPREGVVAETANDSPARH